MTFDSFSELLEYYAKSAPDAPALRFSGTAVLCGKEFSGRLTYGELAEAVEARAAQLAGCGRNCIAVTADGSVRCVTDVLAANAAGLQIVMADESAPKEAIRAITESADEDCEDRILFFTSGTTSRSKAVVLTGRSLCSSAWNGSQMLPLSPEDTLLCVLPLAHVFGFVCGLLWGLSCGACVALGSGTRGIFTDFAAFRPTAVSLVPAQLAYMLKAETNNPELKTVLIGAGDCPPALIDAAKAKGLHVCFGYGLTETSSGVAISTGGDPFALDICPDDRIVIADDGEVLIYAPTCIMQGYYKDPAATEAAFADGSGSAAAAGHPHCFLKSGDLGYLDADGRLRITGRKKDMLVLSDGTKIFLPEYEADIAAALAEGGQNAPEAAADLKNGRPVLILSGPADREAIIKKLQPLMETLPRGQQITDVIILDEPLPRTATGKLKRWEIRQKAGLQ